MITQQAFFELYWQYRDKNLIALASVNGYLALLSQRAFGELTAQQNEYVDTMKSLCPEAIAVWYAPSAYSELGIDIDFGISFRANRDWPARFRSSRTDGLEPVFGIKGYANWLLLEIDDKLTKDQTSVMKLIVDQCEQVRANWFSITALIEEADDLPD